MKLRVAALLAVLFTKASAQPCDLKRDSDGIRVYTCKTEAEKFKSLRAEFELINVTKGQLKEFLWQVSNYATWQYNLTEAWKIDSTGVNSLAYRALIDAPWPVENRELVVNMKVSEADSIMRIDIEQILYTPQPPNHTVRVPFFQAQWLIVPRGNNLFVTYTLRIDPGGYVPAWLVNIAMADGPYQSFKNLKNQLESRP